MSSLFKHLTELGDQGSERSVNSVILSELTKVQYEVTCPSPCVNFVVEGEERYVVNHRTHVVKAGQFIFLPAGTRADGQLPSKDVTRALCVYVSKSRFAGSIPAARLFQQHGFDVEQPDACFVLNGSSSSFGRALERVASRVAAEPTLGESWSGSIFRYFEHHLPIFIAHLSLQAEQITALKRETRVQILQRLERARAHLHDSGSTTVPLGDLSRVAGMSQYYLTRLFKAVYGQPPAKYHRLLRLNAASARLSSGSLTPEGAAEACGYSDLSSLRRALRRSRDKAAGGPDSEELARSARVGDGEAN